MDASLVKLADKWKEPLVASRTKWLHPDRYREAPDLQAHNNYAYLLKTGGKEHGKASAEAMYGRVSTLPWGYLGDPLEEFAEAYR